MKPCEGVNEKDWALCYPGQLGVRKEGVELGTGDMWVSPPRNRGGGGES